MDASLLNTLALGLLGLVMFFHLLHTTVRSAVRLGTRDAQQDKDSKSHTSTERAAGNVAHDA